MNFNFSFPEVSLVLFKVRVLKWPRQFNRRRPIPLNLLTSLNPSLFMLRACHNTQQALVNQFNVFVRVFYRFKLNFWHFSGGLNNFVFFEYRVCDLVHCGFNEVDVCFWYTFLLNYVWRRRVFHTFVFLQVHVWLQLYSSLMKFRQKLVDY